MRAGRPRTPRRRPLTARGTLFFLTGTAVLLTGLLRSELAALLWGAGILFLVLYSLAAVPLAAALTRGRVRSGGISFSLALEPKELYPGCRMEARLRIYFPGLPLPGVFGSYLYKAATPEGSRYSWDTGLCRCHNDISISLTAPRRGVYQGPPGFILLRDLFGFAAAEVSLPGEERLTVYPEIFDREVPLGARTEGGEKTLQVSDLKRSDEFLEIRTYVPGDDVRRINWKIFAHAEDLMLRIGEEEPPPESVTLLLLDPRINPDVIPATLVPAMTDRMASLAARLVLSLSGRGRRAVLSVPESREPLPVEPDRPGPALSLLAGLGSHRDKAPSLPADIRAVGNPRRIIVLAFPGGEGIREITESAGGWNAGILLGLVGPGEEAQRGKPHLRDMVFLPPPGKESPRRARLLDLRTIHKRLREDKTVFENGPERVEHVEIL